MSNYPPTPSFGGLFSVKPRLPSSTSVVARNDQQRSNGLKSALHMPQDTQSKLAANAYSFNANAQAVNLEAFGSEVPPPQFLNLAQFPHGSLPPPPFPPVPIPQNGFPAQFPILAKSVEPSSISAQSSQFQQTKRPLLAPQTRAGNSTPHTQIAASEGEREEGELSDREVKAASDEVTQIAGLQSPRYQVREPKLSPGEPSSNRQDEHHESSLTRTQDYNQRPRGKDSLNILPKTRSPLAGQNMRPRDHDILSTIHLPKESHLFGENRPYDRYLPKRRASGSLLQTRAISPASQIRNRQAPLDGQWSPSKEPNKTHPRKNTTESTVQSQFTGQRYSPTIGKSVIDIRKLAKSALLGLLPHSIRYADLLAAGVDETTLRSLYEEIGVKVPPKTPPTASAENMGQNQSVELPAPNNHKGDDLKHRAAVVAQPPSPRLSSHSNLVKVYQPAQTNDLSFETVSTTPTSVGPKRHEAVTMAKSTDANIAPSLPRSNLPTVNASQPTITSSSKTLERKDYIARMLAAKTGKPQPSSAQLSQAPLIINSQFKDVHEDHVGAPFGVSSLEVHQATNAPVAKSKTMDTEAIKQAQTNLARQKMEALKNRTLTHREPSAPLQSESQTSQAALPTRRASDSSTSAQAQQVVPVQSSASQSPPESNHVSQSMSDSSKPSVHTRPDEARVSMAPFSGIPGLFMTSAPLSNPQVITSHHVTIPRSLTPVAINPTNNPRKRPLAADLNDLASNTVKRPFGQSRQIEVVIDVSDDEAVDGPEDSEIDFEDTEKAIVSKQSQTNLETSTLRGLRDPPPSSHIAIRKPVLAASALKTPSAPETPGTGKQPEDLKTREEQIQLMHLKIAELEQRRKSKQTSSRAETPGTPKLQTATLDAGASPTGTMKTLGETKPDIEPLSEDVSEKAEANKLKLADISAAEKQNALERQKMIDAQTAEAEAEQLERAIAEVAEQKRRRKAEIEFGLPILDAEVERTQMRLEEMKKEMYRLEAEVQKGLEGRKSLIEELESLGIDTEGMPLAELQAKKDEIMKQQHTVDKKQGESTVSRTAEVYPLRFESLAKKHGPPSPSVIRYSFARCFQAELDGLKILSPSVPTDDALLPSFAGDANSVGVGEQADNHTRSTTAEESDKQQTLVSFDHSRRSSAEQPVEQTVQDMMDISRSSAEEGEITDDSQQDMIDDSLALEDERDKSEERLANGSIDTLSRRHGSGRSPQSLSLSIEDEYAPDPAQLAPADGDLAAPTSAEAQSQKPLQDFTTVGEVQMESISSARCDSLEKSHSSDDLDGSEDSDVSTDLPDSEIYEPPEPALQAHAEGTDPHSPPFSPLPSDTVVRIEKETDPAPSAAQAFSSPNTLLRAAEGPEIVKAVRNEIPLILRKEGRFVPYESPLKQFKAYRYHPNYISEVPGGFRSITYSHNINSDMPVCRYEAAGGICNDSTCDSQHFRNMGLSDDMILVQMGSVHEGRTPEERDEYVSGLKQIIQDMRGRKVKDFNTVASEIAAYRSRFLKDPSRILLL